MPTFELVGKNSRVTTAKKRAKAYTDVILDNNVISSKDNEGKLATSKNLMYLYIHHTYPF